MRAPRFGLGPGALFALKGHVLSCTLCEGGPVRFYVTRWDLVRELRDIAAVRVCA